MCNEEMKKHLIEEAIEAMVYSYNPYSGFSVGAALLTEDNEVYKGCNIENAAFSPTNCAERTAFFKAVSEGHRRFKAIAICGGPGGVPKGHCAPCGVCRQVMSEFCDPETFEIIEAESSDDYEVWLLKDILPGSFVLKD